jgi:hypothetical protein
MVAPDMAHELVGRQPPAWDPRLLWASLALVGALLLGALIISIVDRWRKRAAQQRITSGDQLTHFRTLYEQGELSSEEFERIRSRLQERLVKELAVSEAPEEPQPPAQPEQQPPDGQPPGSP